MTTEGEISEEEVAAHVVYVATREENAHHMTPGLLASLQSGAMLTFVERIELRRWLAAVAAEYEGDETHWHDLLVGAARSGRVPFMRRIALESLRLSAIASARVHREGAANGWQVETKLVRVGGKLEVR